MERVVAKFGGTSVADAGQVRRTMALVQADPRRRVVVVSAPGKRDKTDKKVTDLLFLSHHLATGEVSFNEPYSIIAERFKTLAADLGVPGAADEALAELHAGLTRGESRDWVASRGEHISARVIATAMGAVFVETGDLLGIDAHGRPTAESYPKLAAALTGDGLFVVPGYYGHGPNGRVKVFSRGGSDITGSVMARAIGAALYENWTDVSGFMMADPRIVPQARSMSEVTYSELRELAYMGASVLHDEAIFPVREAGIPIHIKNTNAPDDPGTLILPTRDLAGTPVVGVAGRRDFTVIHISKAMMNKELGVGRRVLGVLETQGVNFEHMPSGIDTMSVVVATEELQDKLDDVIEEIKRVIQPDDVQVFDDLALITTVGLGMAHQVGIAGRCFGALAQHGINVRMISQGMAELNIIVGVQRDDFEEAVRALYEAFVVDLS
ncbi:MAG: aspartate kinase [Armatimonadetes bacterium]|nr:aspartate kinase [Armatimonadota bacterium]